MFRNTLSRSAILLALASIPAAANVLWTLNDVTFNSGDTATGWFLTDDAVSQYLGFNIVISGPLTAEDFTVTQMTSSYLPGTIGAANGDFSQYMDLVLATDMTGAGGTVAISSGFDCAGGCGTLVVNPDTEVTGVFVAPEPSTGLLFLAAFVFLVPLALRQKDILQLRECPTRPGSRR
jgi:hypothetical protein